VAIGVVGRLEGHRGSSLLNHTFSSQVDGSTRDLRPFARLHVAVRQIQDRLPVRPRASNWYAVREARIRQPIDASAGGCFGLRKMTNTDLLPARCKHYPHCILSDRLDRHEAQEPCEKGASDG
jgi:hypothetical protein